MSDRYSRPPRRNTQPYRRAGDDVPRRNAQPYRYTEERNTRSYRRAGESVPRRSSAAPRGTAREKRSSGSVLDVLKKIGKVLLSVIMLIGGLIAAGFEALVHGISMLDHWLFDRFRRDEVRTIIVNTCRTALVILLVLGILFLLRTPLRRAGVFFAMAFDRTDWADSLTDAMENDGVDTSKERKKITERFIVKGCYRDADAQIALLADGELKAELSSKNAYAEANALYTAGSFTEAAQIFYGLDTYSDSTQRYSDCCMALAVQKWESGDENGAYQLLLGAEDSYERVRDIALHVTKSEEKADAVAASELFSASNLASIRETMTNLASARETMPHGRIAAGRGFTLGLKRDGTVLAAGDNTYGQLEAAGWSGITEIAAGSMHAAGLKSDGTVVTCGDNSQGQCDTSVWTDIVMIACGSYDTYGLRRDGTVVAAGMHASEVSGWHNVTEIQAGSYSAGCIYDQGSMISTSESGQLGLGVTLYGLSVYGPVSIGILYDGTTTATSDAVPQWNAMAAVTATGTGVLGITAEGDVIFYEYRSAVQSTVQLAGKAVEVESSGTHHVILTEDGHVTAFGDNDKGQCNVSSWELGT